MPRQIINFRLIGAIVILGGGLLNTANAVANPALGMSIAPNSSVSVGYVKPRANTVTKPAFGKNIALNSGVTVGYLKPGATVEAPRVILHRPLGYSQKGTHANAIGGQVHRHRVSVPLTVRHDMVRSAF